MCDGTYLCLCICVFIFVCVCMFECVCHGMCLCLCVRERVWEDVRACVSACVCVSLLVHIPCLMESSFFESEADSLTPINVHILTDSFNGNS